MHNDPLYPGFRRRWRPRYLLYALLALGVFLAMGWLVQWLWNAILPQVAAVGPLRYWQALGLLLLSRILFGGWRGRRAHRGGVHWNGKWQHMSEEERERYRSAFRDRCRRRNPSDES